MNSQSLEFSDASVQQQAPQTRKANYVLIFLLSTAFFMLGWGGNILYSQIMNKQQDKVENCRPEQYSKVDLDTANSIDDEKDSDPKNSTPEPTENVAIDSSEVVRNVTKVVYFQPENWSLAGHFTNRFQVGYNASTHEVDFSRKYGEENDIHIVELNNNYTYGTTTYALRPYDGGSRHAFIYKQMGSSPDKMQGSKESNLQIGGKNCLLMDGFSISMGPTVHLMCVLSNTEAFYMTAHSLDMETIKTILFK